MSVIDPRLIGQRRTGPDRKLDPTREIELLRDYADGVKLLDMQERYGLSKKGIYDVLDRHGVERSGRKKKADSPTTGDRPDTPATEVEGSAPKSYQQRDPDDEQPEAA